MPYFQALAQGHHGYPQPEDDYYRSVYSEFCLRCGIHGHQNAPFRIKRSQIAPHSAFLQLNGVFDVFFARTEVAMELAKNGIRGLAFGPALDPSSENALRDRQQVTVSPVVCCLETSRLTVVTCQPENEESRWKIKAGRTRFDSSTPYCGRMKFHPPLSVCIRTEMVQNTLDVFQTEEWFGSGGEAHRLTICTERLAELVTSRGWRGIEFRKVHEGGYSQPRSRFSGRRQAPLGE